MKTLTIIALLGIFAVTIFAQSAAAQNQVDISSFALNNVQQEGNFYFLPFPPDRLGDGKWRISLFEAGAETAQDAQVVLTVLAEFEKHKKLEITRFQLIRNQTARGVPNQVFGILLKAIPKKK